MGQWCRSCGVAIEWAKTEAGRWIPVDPEPVPGGNLKIDRTEWPPRAKVISKGEGALQLLLEADGESEEGEVLGHVSHFVSCPQAREWRST